MAKHSPAIHRQMPIQEIVTYLPQAKSVLAEYGLHCFSCAGSEFETLAEGCASHGFPDDEIDELVDDLNGMLRDMPKRPQTLTVTLDGARAIRKVAEDEGRQGEGLAVIADAAGGFCMEFCNPSAASRATAEGLAANMTFVNPGEPDVRVFASELTLSRIGGATIDFREGRFKLDLPEDTLAGGSCPVPEPGRATGTGCGCNGGTCGCGKKSH
ncbi:DUF1858 domain-containing protein [Candidatus Peribacteria bacterium]|nr:DUF1858 domain-containing protein [Candidatus Peribacteria bacterium]